MQTHMSSIEMDFEDQFVQFGEQDRGLLRLKVLNSECRPILGTISLALTNKPKRGSNMAAWIGSIRVRSFRSHVIAYVDTTFPPET